MRISYLLLPVFILAASCNKFLDVKPKGKLIPTSVAEYAHLLDNPDVVQYPFLNNNSQSMLAYMTDNISLSEGIGKVYYKASNSPSIDNYYGYIFRAPYRNPSISAPFWDWGTYRSMKYFNNVIDGIHSLGDAAATADAQAVLAQAYTSRAWSYFHTTMVYGPVYRPGGDNSAKTIPYVTSSDVSLAAPPLSTHEEVFRKVLADLHTALPHAPEVTNFPSRPNKAATQAMLAYYHLFTGKYDSVVYYADMAWKASAAQGADKVLYNFNDLYYTNPANELTSGIISPDSKMNLPNSREILLFRAPDNSAGRASASYPSDEFIALFDKDTDLRYKYYLLQAPGYKTTTGGVSYDDGNKIQYYRGVLTPGSTVPLKFQMTAGFTYPELLLMRAEGYARTNRISEAVADLNLLRRYRYVTGTPDLALPASADEAIRLVLEERRRELPVGHLKRFMDLKRFCLEPGKPWAKTKIVHELGAEQYEGTIDSPLFTLPIANNVLSFNPEWGIPLDTRPFN
ncbi:hypothetical protein HNQ91_002355 [Filimonas zeae]|uniref:SusD family protein n=1 Tax=Filimonas zeae TaxID=1737353 RepID=A0A917ITR4_9BACT|nr:RagB/SusD family nutrient uptake outer membrane protein [Filimonas zeae]MDR6339304.1 hypothetical protein [Filimonas zeae]GGH64204.1 hypothetical protein GCM10011379_15990 [Filimonas zeae]